MKRRNRFLVTSMATLFTLTMTGMTAFAGSLTVSAPTSVSFPALTLDGQPQVDSASLSPVSIADTTGSGAGYHLTVQATPVTENGGKGVGLPQGSLTLQAPSAISAQPQGGLNLLQNPGFESGTQGWTLYGSSSSTSIQTSLSTSVVHSGNYSYEFNVTNLAANSYVHLHQWIYGLTAGAQATSSIWVNVTSISNSRIHYVADFYDSSGNFTGELGSSYVTAATNGWFQLTVSGTVPANSTKVAIYPRIETTTGGAAIFYVDDADYQESDATAPIGTSNLMSNGGFETTEGTSNLFSNNFSSGQAWNNTSGAVSFGSNGVTMTSNNSTVVTKDDQWFPYPNANLMVEGTFVTPSSVPITAGVQLWQDPNNNYQIVWQGDEDLVIYKVINGTSTPIAATGTGSGVVKQSPNATYTLTLSLSTTGALTGSLYSGSNNGGTPLATITASDTNLHGPFGASVYGDNTMRFTGLVVNGGWPAGWGNYTQGSVGSYSVVPTTVSPADGSQALQFSAYDVGTGAAEFWMEGIGISPGVPFTATGKAWIKTLHGVHLTFQIDWFDSSGNYITSTRTNYDSTTNGYVPIQIVGTTPANVASGHVALVLGDTTNDGYGTVEADDITFQYGTVTQPAVESGAPWTIDTSSPVAILSAPQWTGMNEYMVTFPNNALQLHLYPATTRVDTATYPDGTPFSTNLTWSIVSGP